ncbi:MAG: cytochrome c biogenesis protein [Puniceicoccaceae bacterium]
MNTRTILRLSVVVFLVYIFSGLFKAPRLENPQFDLHGFARLPIQSEGRVKPLDSAARNSLMILRGRTFVELDDGSKMSAIEWLLETAARPTFADTLRIFRIDHPDLLALLRLDKKEKYFSFSQLRPWLSDFAKAHSTINEKIERRDSYERALAKLYNAVSIYHGLVHSFHPPDNSEKIDLEYAAFLDILESGILEVRQTENPEDIQKIGADGQRLIEMLARYRWLSQNAYLGIQPPSSDSLDQKNWLNIGSALMATPAAGEIPFAATAYAEIIAAYNSADPERFNTGVAQLANRIEALDPGVKSRVRWEERFNRSELFYKGAAIYFISLLGILVYWLMGKEIIRSLAVRCLLVGFIAQTIGIVARILIQGYAPITNLYSSAVFVGWGAVGLGLLFERIFKSGVASASSSLVGFITLIIAHHLSKSGDTMEMMRAVLDSNFWLATHVTIVTLGYVGTFLAGTMAAFFLLRGVFTSGFTRRDAARQATMVYATICFAILTSFVGTMLGGIWADQSWGRFWGWDPKENGALLVVLWNAVILHARWGGLVRNRGLMVLVIGGNIVTAWSWFGTNMLGVGLHSYGFMDAAFLWLMVFNVSQIGLMLLGAIPVRHWKSPKAA